MSPTTVETPGDSAESARVIAGGSQFMFASYQVAGPLVLRPRPDRRGDDRFVHSQPVQINGMPAVGRDISSKGIAVITGAPVAVGDVVRLSVAEMLDSTGPRITAARVARVDRRAERLIVGLEFLHQ